MQATGVLPINPHGSNSTMFTRCCEVAICKDQKCCPVCGGEIIGHDAESDYMRDKIRWQDATKHWERS